MEVTVKDKIAQALFEAHVEATAALKEEYGKQSTQMTYGQQTFYLVMAERLLRKVSISVNQ